MLEAGEFDDAPVELIQGVVVEKMSKTELHIFLVRYLFERASEFCPSEDYYVQKEDPITLPISELEPDISIVRGNWIEFARKKPATGLLVIEVAISSLNIDRAKSKDYAEGGIPEYWIVCPEKGVTEIYRNPIGRKYKTRLTVPADGLVASEAVPGFEFHLADALSVGGFS